MSVKTLTLAKSLHTVSVLVNVARIVPYRASLDIVTDARLDATCRVDAALRALGYAGAADPYDLRGKAIAALVKS